MVEIVESLEDETFRIYRETRAGLALFSANPEVAKGQLAASTFMQMVVRPHIMHVVGFCEADHAAKAQEVIESCNIVKGVIRHTLSDEFSIAKDRAVLNRKEELLREARYLLDFIRREYAGKEALLDAEILCDCVKRGYIDAVHITKNDKYRGTLKTKIVGGKCVACSPVTGEVITERERLSLLKASYSLPNAERKAI